MEQPSDLTKQKGHYLGTEVDEKWWKRHTKNKLLARGNGEFWIDRDAFLFRRYLTKNPIEIRFEDIVDITIGSWHSGRWYSGRPIVKIVWMQEGVRLSSGFVVAKDQDATVQFVDDLKEKTGITRQTDG